MEIFKIAIIGLIGAIAVNVLKETGSPLYTYVTIVTGIIILIFSINALYPILIDFNALIAKTNFDEENYVLLLKIIGIGYISEYSASLCCDLNCESIAKKIIFAGKIFVFILAIPIIKKVFDLLMNIIWKRFL